MRARMIAHDGSQTGFGTAADIGISILGFVLR